MAASIRRHRDSETMLAFMRNAVLLVAVFCLASPAHAMDWLTMPSTYSHNPVSGTRVAQYAPVNAPTAPIASNFRTSGYTHTRSSLAFGQSADNYHRVEQWGDPVRPYGEWRFPYRPFSTPYPNWGAPYAGLNLGFGGAGFGGQGFGGQGFGGQGFGGVPGYQPGLPRGGAIGRPNRPGDPTSGLAPLYRNPQFQNQVPPNALNSNPLNPYPAGPGTPYPVAPYYDGYHPVYRE